jgi:hypothetical protein
MLLRIRSTTKSTKYTKMLLRIRSTTKGTKYTKMFLRIRSTTKGTKYTKMLLGNGWGGNTKLCKVIIHNPFFVLFVCFVVQEILSCCKNMKNPQCCSAYYQPRKARNYTKMLLCKGWGGNKELLKGIIHNPFFVLFECFVVYDILSCCTK